MMLFWSISAAMILVALAILAMPLLRGSKTATADRTQQNILIARERLAELDSEKASGRLSDEEHAAQQHELEKVLLQDTQDENNTQNAASHLWQGRSALLGLVVLLPLLSILLYRQLGTPTMIETSPPPTTATAQQNSPHAGSLAQMAAKLRQRLEQDSPNDGNGWFLLGRTYMTMKDYPAAAEAFEHSYQLMPRDPGVILALADALSMSSGGNMQGRPGELVGQALSMEPDNATAMWMGGLVAEGKGEYQRALELWNKLLPRFAGVPSEQQQLKRQIARVSQKAGLPVPQETVLPTISSASKPMPVDSAGTAKPNAKVELKITLSPELQQQANPDDTVFIYAKAMQGPRFPLAAVRRKVSELPLSITLDDSSAVMAAAKLSDFSQVKVGARISHSGNAMAQSGDLIGEQENIQVGASGPVDVTIDHVY